MTSSRCHSDWFYLDPEGDPVCILCGHVEVAGIEEARAAAAVSGRLQHSGQYEKRARAT